MDKKGTEWVLVDTVSMFRMRYMVEVPLGKEHWALDTVTMKRAKEFSQKHLDETIISHRVISKKEALKICDQDNDYVASWNNETKIKNFFSTIEEEHEKSDNADNLDW